MRLFIVVDDCSSVAHKFSEEAKSATLLLLLSKSAINKVDLVSFCELCDVWLIKEYSFFNNYKVMYPSNVILSCENIK